MRYRICLGNVAWILAWSAVAMIAPILVSLITGEYEQTVAFSAATIIVGFIAGATLFALRGERPTSSRVELLVTPILG